ncbi:MAG TPA: xanthine dehydrogenase molybdopterin binding subunit [Bacteroidales bacterium]|nr:xanthine dehydrogenase molybdopterin binding subunit [Bacteroidales bacterium]
MKNTSEKYLYHDSAELHATGKAVYVNDMEVSGQTLYGRVVYSSHARAEILRVDVSEAGMVKGVHAVLTYRDIPGENQMGPVAHDEPCLAVKEVNAIGQAVVLIAAESEDIAIEAEKLVKISYKPLKPLLDIKSAMAADSKIAPTRKIERGDVKKALSKSRHSLSGELYTGAQEQWYLETQSALCVPGEGSEMMVYASSQNPAETQAIVAEVLGVSKNEVVCEVKRMGGGFGGKETQGNHVAAWAALLARATGHAVMIHLFRDDDQKITGKRHPFWSTYTIGFDDEGTITAYTVDLNADAGHAADLSMAILERAMLHADNAYYIPDVSITATAWRTNHFSNTAFRGFGGPQGIAVIEHAMDRIARFLKKDAAEIRLKNFYTDYSGNITPYHQKVENIRLQKIYTQIVKSAEYEKRKKAIDLFNKTSKYIKRGISLTPVKFGISFTTSFLNQAGALVNIYRDGSVLVNHGGTEMGQGLYTKMRHIAAAELGISAGYIKVNATNTSKVPNTSATAASSGSDLNGAAVKNAVDTLKSRLTALAAATIKNKYAVSKIDEKRIIFSENSVFDSKFPQCSIPFPELVEKAYISQISLSATGFYKTPDIYFDREKGRGKPFHYFSYGMAVAEVEVDVLTGSHKLIRADILHDVGDSLNKPIDMGQVCGAFIQGVGWITTEEIKWDDTGRLLTCSPDTYKIPTVQDIPEIFNIHLLENAANYNTIRKSKAVGEPPFILAFSVWMALRYAVAAAGNHQTDPDLPIPATNEKIALAVENIRNKK